jgi:YQGE family putative transporter
LQLCSIYISKKIIKEGNKLSPEEPEQIEMIVLEDVATKLV